MRTPTSLRTIALLLMSASVALANPTPQLTTAVSPAPGTASAVDPQILALQAQVASLQAQLNALAAAVRVTPAGLVLQGSTVSIVGGAISVQSQTNLVLLVGKNANLEVGGATSLATATDLKLTAGGAAVVAGSGTLDLRGSSVRLNGSSKPVALLGSAVANGQVLNGSPNVFAN